MKLLPCSRADVSKVKLSKECIHALFALAMATAGQLASASQIVTLDFEEPLPVQLYEYSHRGFTLSTNGHFDVVGPTPPDMDIYPIAPSRWLGWDLAGRKNPNYDGPQPPLFQAGVYITFDGGAYSLLSLLSIGIGDWYVTSSGGGFLDARDYVQDAVPTEISFTGPGWRDITWLFVVSGDSGNPNRGFDDLVFRIPEPASLALLGIGLVALGLARRRGSCALSDAQSAPTSVH